jgi:DNA-binding transcriptional regulator/RsmH inhibitor MraZ
MPKFQEISNYRIEEANRLFPYLGIYSRSSDQGRIILPKRLTDKFKERLKVLDINLDHFYVSKEKEGSLEYLSFHDYLIGDDLSKFSVVYFEKNNDSRLALPKKLRMSGNGVCILGLSNHFEIWTKEGWQKHQESLKS